MTIVAAVDRSDRAADVIREAEILAKAFNDSVHVVHVLTNSEFIELERTSVERDSEGIHIDQIREVAADIAKESVINLDVPSEVVGLMGDPAERIVDYADKQSARYIVVTGRKQSPTKKAMFGSTAQSILLNANSPVVISTNS